MSVSTIRNYIIKLLYDKTGVPVVPQNSSSKRPPYPYITYNITAPYRVDPANAGNKSLAVVNTEDPVFDKNVRVTVETQPQMVMSFNAYSRGAADDFTVAFEKAQAIAEIFRFIEYESLSAEGIVVVDVSNFTDRTAFIVDGYEARIGFDVTFRFADSVDFDVETIETIEIDYKE